MITLTHQLTLSHLNALQELLHTCQITDKCVIPVHAHLLEAYRSGPPSLLCYQEGELIGMLALFQFYADAAEIALLIHPAYRKQGIAKSLWDIMCQVVQQRLSSLKYFIVSTPQGLNQTWFNQHAFQFKQTDYDMICTPYTPKPTASLSCTIQPASHADIKALYNIDRACFNPNRPDAIQRLERLLSTSNIKIFLMYYQEQCIGQVHLVFEENNALITDFAVLPHVQHHGFGQILLAYCLQYTHEHHQSKITLTVRSTNQHALHLYQNMGFQIYNAVDYYKRAFSLDKF
jgi:ribosomal protein S18 acetylase RimI-like enzyme